MAQLSKVEQLREILRRLMEFKKKGGVVGIDKKIGEVQLELRRHLREKVYWESEESEEEVEDMEWEDEDAGEVEIEQEEWDRIMQE